MSKHHRRSGPRLPRGQQSTFAHGEHRHNRLEKILHEELQSLLRDEAADPDLQAIVVVAVELSPDGGNARIAYAVQAAFAVEAEARDASREALARGNGFLRARLASLLNLKKLPKLGFTFLGVREGGESWPG
ncbi:MAG TPA: ribosome-binding factor A [Myxococcales bacterium]|jgi:ribosome-binding factor A|nr:ribosome-binding factor A [Myxococcales bacterium]